VSQPGQDDVAQGLAVAGLPEVALSRPIADRAAYRRGDGLVRDLVADPATRVLEISAGRARLVADVAAATGSAPVARARLLLRAPRPDDVDRLAIFLGEDGEKTAFLAVDVEPADDARAAGAGADPDAGGWLGLRALAPVLEPGEAGLVVQAVAVLNWHAAHRHCPRCGAATTVTQAGYARLCPVDQSQHWPRTDPAVIMTIVDDDDRVLLGRHAGWPSGRFSTLAGFVEPGETLETAVRREAMEEVGVVVDDVAYLGSQPWPFPSSIMLGFRGHAATTSVRPDGVEIAEARWFTRAELLQMIEQGVVGLSPRLSISRSLIEHWYGGRLPDPPPMT
jgi:NAD+ diphosphatase